MSSRSLWSQRERAARSRLAQILHERDILRGSVLTMQRTCGKKTCRCQQGDKHVSLYLSIKQEGKRKLIYIPAELEEAVETAVANFKQSQQLIEEVSQACLDRVVMDKKRERKKK